MSKRIIFVACALLALTQIVPASLVAQAAGQDRELYSSVGSSGQRKSFRVSETRLLSTKPWSPDVEPPPLSVAKAVAAARKYAKPTRPKDLTVVKVEMSASGGKEWRWFYLIEFFDVSTARADTPKTVEVLVLMDGSIVEASVR
jgi:hypothetical protein